LFDQAEVNSVIQVSEVKDLLDLVRKAETETTMNLALLVKLQDYEKPTANPVKKVAYKVVNQQSDSPGRVKEVAKRLAGLAQVAELRADALIKHYKTDKTKPDRN